MHHFASFNVAGWSATGKGARGASDNGPRRDNRMLKNLKKLIRDEEGATAVEYGLIVAAIAGLIVVVVFLLGGKVNNAFGNVASKMP